MLPLHTHAKLSGSLGRQTFKVLRLSEALDAAYPLGSVIVDGRGRVDIDSSALYAAGFGAVLGSDEHSKSGLLPSIHSLNSPDVVGEGDVIRVRDGGKISVLYRRAANANALFVTERCNSHCLMCSQPPRDEEDAWRINELLDFVPLIDRSVSALAITGGEPTLLGARLGELIECVVSTLPQTQLNVLTNARALSDVALADCLTKAGRDVLWAVPVYADTAARHDFIVQVRGAFEETLNGIYNLAERQAAIEVRVVLHQHTIGRLTELAEFIWRTMPFVAHVAFMGLEPMGYSRVNRDVLYVDPLDYRAELEAAVWHLHDRGITSSIYNTPLCVLSREIWPLARNSISDWKNIFVYTCDECAVKHACSGFFMSAGDGWRSRGISSIKGEVCPCPGIGVSMCARCLVGRAQAPSCSQEPQVQH